MIKGECPSCHGEVLIEDAPNLDERLPCPSCKDILKVISLDPLKLEWAFEDLLEGPEYSIRSFPMRWRRFP